MSRKEEFINDILEMIEFEDGMQNGEPDEIIYIIDDIIIYGDFYDGIRNADHNVLLFDGITWEDVIGWGTVVVPETKTYISDAIIENLENIGFSNLPTNNNHIIKTNTKNLYLNNFDEMKSFFNQDVESARIPIIYENDGDSAKAFSIKEEDFEDYINVLKDSKIIVNSLSKEQIKVTDFPKDELFNSIESLNLSIEIAEVLRNLSFEDSITESGELFSAMINHSDDSLTIIFDNLELDELQQSSYRVHDKLHSDSDYMFVDNWIPFSPQSKILNTITNRLATVQNEKIESKSLSLNDRLDQLEEKTTNSIEKSSFTIDKER